MSSCVTGNTFHGRTCWASPKLTKPVRTGAVLAESEPPWSRPWLVVESNQKCKSGADKCNK